MALVGSLFFAAWLFMLAEGGRYFDAFYWACVTAPTIGFGDISPKTDVGKLVFMGFMPL